MRKNGIEIVEEYLLEDCEYENGVKGYHGRTIPQRYWQQAYTGIENDDYYDYN